MKIGLLANIVSPHQVPLAKELVRQVGVENFLYVYSEPFHEERAKLGWQSSVEGLIVRPLDAESRTWLEDADFVYLGNRDFELMERRLAAGRTTCYMSERWLKPIPIGGFYLSGSMRLLVPGYRRMCRRFVRLFDSPNFRYFAFGPWAKRDMMAICRRLSGRDYAEKIVPWGYFVESGHPELRKPRPDGAPLRILWVGRMLRLKRVDTIIRAVREIVESNVPNNHQLLKELTGMPTTGEAATVEVTHLNSPSTHTILKKLYTVNGETDREIRSVNRLKDLPFLHLTLVGDGPEKPRLQKMAKGLPVTFLPSQPIEKIRELMREHDVFVFASNGFDGWGAVVSEAVEEGMRVLGTCETGAAASILPEGNLFHCGDYRALAEKLVQEIPLVPIGEWSAARAAERLLTEVVINEA